MKPSGFFDDLKAVLSNRKILILLIVVLILFSFAIIYSQFAPSKPFSQTPSPTPSNKGINNIIAKVGEENIYQGNIDNLKKYYGYDINLKDEKTDKVILDTLIKESVAIQAAINDNIIPDNNIPENISINDQIKRSQIVENINQQILEKSGYIEGTLLAIWFYNGKPANIGLEEGKKLAFSKLSRLQNMVKNKTLTIEEAGSRIVNDASLNDLDTNYKGNAVWKFHNYLTEPIVFDENFNKVIRSLNPGEISDVFLVKDTIPSTGESVESAYMFCQISNKQEKGGTYTYEDWLNEKIKNYEVNYQ